MKFRQGVGVVVQAVLFVTTFILPVTLKADQGDSSRVALGQGLANHIRVPVVVDVREGDEVSEEVLRVSTDELISCIETVVSRVPSHLQLHRVRVKLVENDHSYFSWRTDGIFSSNKIVVHVVLGPDGVLHCVSSKIGE